MGKDAAFEAFKNRLAHVGAGRVVVALPVELSRSVELNSSFKVLGDGARGLNSKFLS